MKPSLYLIEKIDQSKGRAILNLHPGQARAWNSQRRFIFVLAGTQGGKTEFAPWWMNREIMQQGSGDYMVVSPNYPLQSKKVTPAYKDVFEKVLKIGTYKKGDRVLEIRVGDIKANIFFSSADNPDSLESVTANAAHLDEAGQKSFKLDAWEAIQRRLAIHQGRSLATTTIYNIGWLKTEAYDRWAAGDADYDVIQFPSTMNPAFSKNEYERAKRILPTWKFDMFYNAVFTRPAGLIYSCISDSHRVPYFHPPADTRKFRGVDFGAVNHMTIWLFEQLVDDERKSIYYVYREATHSNLTAKEHVAEWKKLEKNEIIAITAGGSKSESQWRNEYRQEGVGFVPPKYNTVEMGINDVYSLIKNDRLYIMQNCPHVWEQLNDYSRVLDDQGEPTEEIDDKEKYHWIDALRYAAPHLKITSAGVGGETADR
jgi:phage terminase large subunit